MIQKTKDKTLTLRFSIDDNGIADIGMNGKPSLVDALNNLYDSLDLLRQCDAKITIEDSGYSYDLRSDILNRILLGPGQGDDSAVANVNITADITNPDIVRNMNNLMKVGGIKAENSNTLKSPKEPKKFPAGIEFREMIQILLKENGMRQVDLAKRLGLKEGTISDWLYKRCNPNYESRVFDELVEALGLMESGNELRYTQFRDAYMALPARTDRS